MRKNLLRNVKPLEQLFTTNTVEFISIDYAMEA